MELVFNPKSQWQSDGTADFDGDGNVELIYDVVNGVKSGALQTPADNLNARQGPYLELEKANAVKISDLYYTTVGSSTYSVLERNTFVFSDMFPKLKNKATGKKTGMPVLYFRADTSKALLKPSNLGLFPGDGLNGTSQDAVYNVNENFPFYMNPPEAGGLSPMWDKEGRELFYKRIANPNFTLPPRPYRASSFILLSAGSDGLYGTADDVYNIDENEK